jgi:CheY-like chemotaxis protein
MAKILLVDDDVILLQNLERILSFAGYECLGVTSGAEAVARYGDFQPDTSLIDVWMPDMDGFETMKLIRAAEPNSRIIIFSGNAVFNDRPMGVVAQELGANAAAEKPFDALELRDLIARVVGAEAGAPFVFLPACAPRTIPFVPAPRMGVYAAPRRTQPH